MPLDAALLAEELWAVNGPVLDKDSIPQPATDEVKAYAEGYVAMCQAALVNFLPGTITGSAPPGGPLVAGQGVGGTMVLSGVIMAAKASQGNPVVSAVLSLEATAIATYLMGAALVSLPVGSVTGNSTEAPPPAPAPGPLVAGAAAPVGGQILGIDGAAMAQTVLAMTGGQAGNGPTAVAHYTALCTHLMTMGGVELKPNTIVGVMTGGQLVGGSGVGGTII